MTKGMVPLPSQHGDCMKNVCSLANLIALKVSLVIVAVSECPFVANFEFFQLGIRIIVVSATASRPKSAGLCLASKLNVSWRPLAAILHAEIKIEEAIQDNVQDHCV